MRQRRTRRQKEAARWKGQSRYNRSWLRRRYEHQAAAVQTIRREEQRRGLSTGGLVNATTYLESVDPVDLCKLLSLEIISDTDLAAREKEKS